MIDVHCLVHREDTEFFPQLQAQMAEEKDANFHIIPNGTSIGVGRCKGFLTGKSEYVSYVDYDDLIVPGIFSKINDVMSTGIPWCFTDEVLVDKDGNFIQPGWSIAPEIYNPIILEFTRIAEGVHAHHILTFRRDLISIKMIGIMEQLAELAEDYLRTELSKYNYVHIDEVGYLYRQHEKNSVLNFKVARILKEMLDDKRMDSSRSND